NTSATCTIHDPGWRRRIVVEKQHSRSTVVWNPFETRASQMSDLGSEHWTGFVCVETANAVDNVLPLAPGERHAMSVRVEEGRA
ncbi:MAG: D-hexose-6-phosphate mutarotase, partial [Tepidisphaeraceae bacterium]